MCYTCIALLVSALPFTQPAEANPKKTGGEIVASPTEAPNVAVPEPNPSVLPSASPAASPSAPAPLSSGSPSVRLPISDEQTIVRLEIFLDQQGFRPGKIDGRWGEFCGKALQHYQNAKGRPSSEEIDPDTLRELEQVSPVYMEYRISPEDLKQVGSVPRTPAGESKLKFVPYSSFLDFVAERFHADPGFLAKINPGLKMNRLKPGVSLKVPNVSAFEIEKLQKQDLPPNPSFAPRLIKVDTHAKMLDVLEGQTVIASYPITPGSKALPAPIGTWKVVRLTVLPIFRWDKEMLNHGRRSSDFYNVPPGPRNPVGIAWIGINKKGIGVHGTNHPDSIGRAASHGCIRLANWDVNSLVGQVTVGNTVEIY